MPIFDTITQLNSYMQIVTIKEITEEVEVVETEVMNERVEKNLYNDVSNSDFYENTFGFRDSAKTKTMSENVAKNGYVVEGSLRPKGNYESFYGGGKLTTDEIIEFIDQGHKGFYKGVPMDVEGKNIIEDSLKDLTKGGYLKKKVSSKLKQLGYVISRQSSI